MTVIIRLQNLPWTANALDIRRFFQGLSIPDGGVHIVGGDKGDAFIAFSTDDDARQAMYMDGRSLCGTPIKLLLSSKTEMQNVIAIARGSVPSAGGGHNPPAQSRPAQLSAAPPLGSSGMGDQRPNSGPQGIGPVRTQDRSGNMGGAGFQQGGQFDRGVGRGFDRSRSDTMGRGGNVRQGGGMDRMGGGNQRQERVESGQNWGNGGQDRSRGDVNRPERPSEHNEQSRDRIGTGRGDRGGNFDRGGFSPRGGSQSGFRDQGYNHQSGRNEREFSGERPDHQRNFGGDDPFDNYEQAENQDDYRGQRFRDSNQEGYNRRQREFIDRRQNDDRRPSRHHGGRFENVQDDNGSQGWDRSYQERDNVDDEYRERSNRGPRHSGRNENSGDRYYEDDRGHYDRDAGNRNDFRREEEFGEHGDDYGEYDRGPMDENREQYHDSWENEQSYSDHGYDEQHMDYEGDVEMQPADDYEDQNSEMYENWGDRFRGRGRGRGQGRFGGRNRGFGRGSNFQGRGGRFDSRRSWSDNANEIYAFVSNMPNTISYKDVRRFFSGCEIPSDGLKLINDRYGNRNGTAYVKFGRPLNCHHALKRSGQSMGTYRLRIERCTQEDYETAIDSYVPPGGNETRGQSPPPKRRRSRSPFTRAKIDGNHCIVMTNVHFRATRLDIRQFLGTCKLHESGGPHIKLGSDGRPTGTAYVRLDSKLDYDEAIKQNKRYFLHRQVTIAPITKADFDKETGDNEDDAKKQTENKEGSKEKDSKDESSTQSNDNEKKFFCIKMRGLPFSATPGTIRDFFEGLEIANRGIHLVTNPQGQAAGAAFVEFVTSSDCKNALEKNKEYIGKRYIEITAITKLDMLEDMKSEQQRANSGNSGPGRQSLKAVPELPGISRPGCTITMSNLPYTVQLEDIMSFLSSCRPIQDSVRLRYSKDGKPTGDAMVAFNSASDAQRALRDFNRKLMIGRPVVIELAQ